MRSSAAACSCRAGGRAPRGRVRRTRRAPARGGRPGDSARRCRPLPRRPAPAAALPPLPANVDGLAVEVDVGEVEPDGLGAAQPARVRRAPRARGFGARAARRCPVRRRSSRPRRPWARRAAGAGVSGRGRSSGHVRRRVRCREGTGRRRGAATLAGGRAARPPRSRRVVGGTRTSTSPSRRLRSIEPVGEVADIAPRRRGASRRSGGGSQDRLTAASVLSIGLAGLPRRAAASCRVASCAWSSRSQPGPRRAYRSGRGACGRLRQRRHELANCGDLERLPSSGSSWRLAPHFPRVGFLELRTGPSPGAVREVGPLRRRGCARGGEGRRGERCRCSALSMGGASRSGSPATSGDDVVGLARVAAVAARARAVQGRAALIVHGSLDSPFPGVRECARPCRRARPTRPGARRRGRAAHGSGVVRPVALRSPGGRLVTMPRAEVAGRARGAELERSP